MRIQSFIAASAASVIVIGMGAIASIAGYMSTSKADATAQRDVPVAVAAKPLDRGCMECGVVVAVRPIELKGKKIEPARTTRRYQVQLRMSDGSVKTVTYGTAPAWKAGDRVRLLNGRVVG